MELRQLRYFRAVAEELNFGRAAARLNLSQPPLSRQIKALEEELGFRLFDRSTGKTQLTHAGRSFLLTTNDLLARLENGIQEGNRIARGEAGILRVGFRETAMYNPVLPNILSQFRELYGDVEVNLIALPSLQQARALEDNELDVGFVYFVPSSQRADLEARTILMDDFVLALHQSHPLASKRNISISDLSQERFVWFPRLVSPVYYDALYEACTKAGFAPRITQYAPYIGGPALHLVSAGMGVSFVQRTPAQLMKPANVILKDVAGLNVSLELSILWNRGNASPLVQALLRLIPPLGCTPRDRRKAAQPSMIGP